MRPRVKSFKQWLKTPAARAVSADFVDDARRDRDLLRIRSWRGLRDYLTMNFNVKDGCLRCARKTWDAYEAYRRIEAQQAPPPPSSPQPDPLRR